MAGKSEGLKPRHYKALELWEEGILSIKEIAKACDFPVDGMYDLFEGNAQKQGQAAHLFKAELDKITTRTSAKVRHLVKDNKKIALEMMNTRLKVLKSQKSLTEKESGEVNKIMGVLNKATPGVEIGSFHALSITKGMTPEELVYEFRRLSAIARNPSLGGGVSGVGSGKQSRIPDPPDTGSSDEEES